MPLWLKMALHFVTDKCCDCKTNVSTVESITMHSLLFLFGLGHFLSNVAAWI